MLLHRTRECDTNKNKGGNGSSVTVVIEILFNRIKIKKGCICFNNPLILSAINQKFIAVKTTITQILFSIEFDDREPRFSGS